MNVIEIDEESNRINNITDGVQWEQSVIKMWRAEHLDDDIDRLTPEWLGEVFQRKSYSSDTCHTFYPRDTKQERLLCVTHVYTHSPTTRWVTMVAVCGTIILESDTVTRGYIRRLMRVLGIADQPISPGG